MLIILRLIVLKYLPILIIIKRVSNILLILNNPLIILSIFIRNVYIIVLLIDKTKIYLIKMIRLP